MGRKNRTRGGIEKGAKQLELFPMESWRYPRCRTILVDQFPMDVPVVLGTISHYYPVRRVRAIRMGWEITNDGIPDSPAVIAKRFILAHRGRYPDEHVSKIIEKMSYPIHVIPGYWDWLVMVDLRRAYENILKRIGVRTMKPLAYFSHNPSYFPPDCPGIGTEDAIKRFYHCFPVVGRSGKIRIRDSDGIKIYERPPIDSRPWGTVMTVLNGLAWLAIRLGAVQVFFDSYAFPREVPSEFADLVRSLGLELRLVSEGAGHIRGVASYRIGNRVSGHYTRTKNERPHIYDDCELGEWCLKVLYRLTNQQNLLK